MIPGGRHGCVFCGGGGGVRILTVMVVYLVGGCPTLAWSLEETVALDRDRQRGDDDTLTRCHWWLETAVLLVAAGGTAIQLLADYLACKSAMEEVNMGLVVHSAEECLLKWNFNLHPPPLPVLLVQSLNGIAISNRMALTRDRLHKPPTSGEIDQVMDLNPTLGGCCWIAVIFNTGQRRREERRRKDNKVSSDGYWLRSLRPEERTRGKVSEQQQVEFFLHGVE